MMVVVQMMMVVQMMVVQMVVVVQMMMMKMVVVVNLEELVNPNSAWEQMADATSRRRACQQNLL